MLTKCERMSNIPKKETARNTKTVMYFDSNVNRDGLKASC